MIARPVAILGFGAAVTPPGILDGTSGPAEVWAQRFDPGADEFIPRNTRRRISRLIAMSIMATRNAGGPDAPDDAPLVFATANGEINTIAAILEALRDEVPSVSPTSFHNSVHNAGPGTWSILAKRFAPTTTLTMGELSFEMALLEALARLSTGDGQVQVTAGDEAIIAAQWADPSHCTHDFCGSVRLGSDPDGTAPRRLVAVRYHPAGAGSPEAFRDALVSEFQPTEATWDLRLAGGDREGLLPDGGEHPCAGLFLLLRFLADPSRCGSFLSVRAGRRGDALGFVAVKESHE
jgi:hypothetical protein